MGKVFPSGQLNRRYTHTLGEWQPLQGSAVMFPQPAGSVPSPHHHPPVFVLWRPCPWRGREDTT